MRIEKSIAPPLSTLRPTKPTSSATFPVYHDLEASLAEEQQQPDKKSPATVAHTLAVAAGYAYSDAKTVSMMLARMGLQDNHCLKVDMSVDAMFIRSTAYLIQSSDGSVVILAYRGTEPTNLVNWLTDADVHPDKIAFSFPRDTTGRPGRIVCHPCRVLPQRASNTVRGDRGAGAGTRPALRARRRRGITDAADGEADDHALPHRP